MKGVSIYLALWPAPEGVKSTSIETTENMLKIKRILKPLHYSWTIY